MAAMTLKTALTNLNSTRAQQAVARAVFFGACSSLRNACSNLEQMSRTIRNLEERFPERAAALRSSNKFAELDKKVDEAANKAAGVHAVCEAHDIMLNVDFAPPLPTATTNEEAQRIADATGLAVDTIIEQRRKAQERKYGAELEAEDFAAAAFWSATAPVSDTFVKVETIEKCIEKTQMYIITWSTPDYAELGMLKLDSEMVSTWGVLYPDENLPEAYEDEEAVAFRIKQQEIKALDEHAKNQAALARLRQEQAQATKPKAQRKRVKAEAATA